MYINGYEVLITAPNEGLLYLPLVKSRVPVIWQGLSIKTGPAGEDYGCVMAGEVAMQGSQTGAIANDLYRQVMALLTQGPGAWSGKLGDSFDAFEKIIAEIEASPSPTPDQFKKFQNIGVQVLKAIDEWIQLIEGNPAGNGVKTFLLAQRAIIEPLVTKPILTKTEVATAKLSAEKLNKKFKKETALQKILQAVKDANEAGKTQVDLTAIYKEAGIEESGPLATDMPLFLGSNSYYPLQYRSGNGIGSPVIININDLSLSDDKLKIEGLNIQGSAEDIEAIWEWLGVEDYKVNQIELLSETDNDSQNLLDLFPPLSAASVFVLPAEALWVAEGMAALNSLNLLRLANGISIASLPFILVGDTNPWKSHYFDLPAFQGGGTITMKLPRDLTNKEIAKIVAALASAEVLHTLNSGEPTWLYKITVLKNGYYECTHCDVGMAYLEAGNIYKYGVSAVNQGNNRYAGESGYVNQQINVLNLRRDNLVALDKRSVALAIEKMLIVGYMIHEENILRRSKGYPWLIRPAGNKIYR